MNKETTIFVLIGVVLIGIATYLFLQWNVNQQESTLSLRERAATYCDDAQVAEVAISSSTELLKVTGNAMSAEETYYPAAAPAFSCPIVHSDEVSNECSGVADITDWEVICSREEVVLEVSGNLVKGNAGMDFDSWYVVYEESGASTSTMELSFTEEVNCINQDEFLICDTIAFQVGDSVDIIGTAEGEIINVSDVTFASSVDTQEVTLYYYNPDLDTDREGNILCSEEGLVPVKRILAATDEIMIDTVQLLLEGYITEEEALGGVTTEYPLSGLELTESTLSDGTFTLTFDDPERATSGGACRVNILWLQIEETALQFSEVDDVTLLPADIFQP